MPRTYARFVISLDFELHWGVRDHSSVNDYRANLLGVREAVPALLEIFERNRIHATWATVGFLFARSRDQLERFIPSRLPAYIDPRLSPYNELSRIGPDEERDPFHFAPSLLHRIAKTPHQEIATHTFSHYYCLEPGQDADAFEEDLQAAEAISKEFGPVCHSIVFPRNQLNVRYVDVLRRRGVKTLRSNGNSWLYRPTPGELETLPRRALRFADSFVPIVRTNDGTRNMVVHDPVDVPASAFLRPYRRRLRALDGLRFRRIRDAMTAAANRGSLFHLWWHPHNFGTNLGENLSFLQHILDHFSRLRRQHGMQSMTMLEAGTSPS